jgi:hypothetical protein
MRSSTVFAFVFSLVITTGVRGQSRPSQVDELRLQIDALQRQLNKLETSQASPTQRVTQLGATRQQRGSPALVVRIYDLSDLFSISPAYTAAIGNDLGLTPRSLFPEAAASNSETGGRGIGGMGGGGGFFAVRDELLLAQTSNGRGGSGQTVSTDVAASAKTTINSLINSITTSIEPDSWEDLSGPGSIARIGTSLIIRNDSGVHEQIDALFTLLRQKWGTLRTVSINAWCLPLTDQQIAKLLPGSGKGKTGVEGIEAYGIVNEAAWAEILGGRVQAEKKAGGGFRSVITCFNGQTVNTTSGSEEAVVNDIEMIVTRGTNNQPEGRVAYHPVVTPIHEGSSLQVTPLVNTSGKFVMLDVHSRVSVREPAIPGGRQVVHDDDQSPAAIVAALDHPRLVTQRLATTLRAPVDRVILVGAMSFSTKPQEDEAPLYLFLRATVQELRDDVKRAVPVEPLPLKEEETTEQEQAR